MAKLNESPVAAHTAFAADGLSVYKLEPMIVKCPMRPTLIEITEPISKRLTFLIHEDRWANHKNVFG